MDSGRPLRRPPVQARAKERLERVLTAAEEVFGEVGFEAATTNEIARRAKTSIGSLYEFLGSKQGIAQALAERYVDDFRRLYHEANIDAFDGSKAIDGLVDLVGGFYVRHPSVGPLLGTCEGSSDLQVARRELRTTLIDPIDHLLAQCPYATDPGRRRLVAEMCVDILWTVAGEAAVQPSTERRLILAELKLVLSSYVTVAFPRS